MINHYHETDERFEKDYEVCPYLYLLTFIGADCNVYTCQDKAYNTSGLLGSIKDRPFREFWYSDENRSRMFGISPKENCRLHCITHAKNMAIMDFLSVQPDHARFV